MLNSFRNIIDDKTPTALFILSYCIITVLSLWVGVASDWYFLMGVPLVLLMMFITVVDFKVVFFLLMACIPLSTEVKLPGGFGIDFPTELLTIGLMCVFGVYLLRKPQTISGKFLAHPISIILYLHIGWILVTTITSANFVVSLKFFLAKIWYVVTFYFLAGHLLKQPKDLRKLVWVIFIPLLLTVMVVLARHSAKGFAFDKVNSVLSPFYRNHVSYAALLALFFPFVYLTKNWFKPTWTNRVLWGGLVLFYLIAVYLTYTRAAYISIILAGGAYIVLRLRLVKLVIVGALIGAVLGAVYMVKDNKYLEYAPDFETTISHKNFNNLVDATYKMEDVSTMERVYRWVAGGHMIAAKPILGFGPGNFYNYYKSYTVLSFFTYVSDNPEKSGIHNYYLMIFVEQGIVGLLIFLLLTLYTLWKAEVIYHQAKDAQTKNFVMMFILCVVIIDAFLLMNDMIETDKVGILYFVSLAVLVNIDNKTQGKLESVAEISTTS